MIPSAQESAVPAWEPGSTVTCTWTDLLDLKFVKTGMGGPFDGGKCLVMVVRDHRSPCVTSRFAPPEPDLLLLSPDDEQRLFETLLARRVQDGTIEEYLERRDDLDEGSLDENWRGE